MGAAASVAVKEGTDYDGIKKIMTAKFGEEKVAEAETRYAKFKAIQPEELDEVSVFQKFAEEAYDDDEQEPTMTGEEAKAALGQLGNIFRKSSEKPPTDHSTLIIDCGTGESKAIYLRYQEHEDGNKTVQVIERLKSPAATRFLEGADATNNEDYKKKLKKAEAMEDEAERNAAIAALNDGYWFLKEKPADATGKLEPKQFVQYCTEVKNQLESDLGKAPDAVMIGASAWARAGDPNAEKLIQDLTESGILCKKLLQTQEGTFEAAACAYAYAKAAGPDAPTLTGVIGSGGGSVQFLHSMKYPINLDCGNKMPLEEMQAIYKSNPGVEILEKCFEKAALYATKDASTTTEFDGRIWGEMNQERGRVLGEGSDVVRQKLGGFVICISACYYGALSCGLHNKDKTGLAAHRCDVVVAKMRETLEATKAKLRGGSHADPKTRKTDLKAVGNLTLQIALLSEFFTDDCLLCFKRDWEIDGVGFRTTWTTGCYLNFLYGMGIKFDGSDVVLDAYQETERKARGLMSDAKGNEEVAMVLVDIKTVIKEMRRTALQIGNPIDKFLNTLAADFGGKRPGWPDFKIKSEGSLYQKLCLEIYSLLRKNEGYPSYTPNIEECVESIHDCLRYTMTFEPDQYTNAVKALEERLLTGDAPIAQSIKFKNFWRENDDETCYQGINAQVCLNEVMDLGEGEEVADKTAPIPNDKFSGGDTYEIPKPTGKPIPNTKGFIFELQLHTPNSFEMKNTIGHKIYEQSRSEKITEGEVMGKHYSGHEFKKKLYLSNKALYRTKKPDGTPLKPGEVVCPGLMVLDEHHEWSKTEEYKFKPFKPDPPICFYDSKVPGANWVNTLKHNQKVEKEVTGIEFVPFGYRIHPDLAEHEKYLASLKRVGASSTVGEVETKESKEGGATK